MSRCPIRELESGGIHGRLALFRAVLLDGPEVVAEVSSLERAEQIAALLNQADAGSLPPRKQSEVQYTHYKATTDFAGKPVVLRAGWGEVEEVVRTRDAGLAEQIATLLERVDPAQKVRTRIGIRWW